MGDDRDQHRMAGSTGDLLDWETRIENSCTAHYISEDLETCRHTISSRQTSTQNLFGPATGAKSISVEKNIDHHDWQRNIRWECCRFEWSDDEYVFLLATLSLPQFASAPALSSIPPVAQWWCDQSACRLYHSLLTLTAQCCRNHVLSDSSERMDLAHLNEYLTLGLLAIAAENEFGNVTWQWSVLAMQTKWRERWNVYAYVLHAGIYLIDVIFVLYVLGVWYFCCFLSYWKYLFSFFFWSDCENIDFERRDIETLLMHWCTHAVVRSIVHFLKRKNRPEHWSKRWSGTIAHQLGVYDCIITSRKLPIANRIRFLA